MAFKPKVYEVKIEKLVYGGQGIGTLADGKKALVWNALPGEKVRLRTVKSNKGFVVGIAEEVLTPSAEREEPLDPQYLSTSPWQMMTYAAENKYKQEILVETLQRAGVDYKGEIGFNAPQRQWAYRNKMEYAFFGDDDGLHLASFTRGSTRKQIVTGSSLANPAIDKTAACIVGVLNSKGIRASELKSLMVRCSDAGACAAALFVRNNNFEKIPELKTTAKGIVVYFSDSRSPASVATRELYVSGNIALEDKLLGIPIKYDVLSFFQVNLEPYQEALKAIRKAVGKSEVTDVYAGVGSIGLTIGTSKLRLIEIDKNSVEMARANASGVKRNVEVIEASSEKAVEYIPSGKGSSVIFDPPRAGLHAKIVKSVLEKQPERVVYLSCNPSTLARDLQLLDAGYEVESIEGYNFFPRTPHIEALAILSRKT